MGRVVSGMVSGAADRPKEPSGRHAGAVYAPHVLMCVECGATATDKMIGWKAHLAYDPREDEESYLVIFCPWCAAREFGDDVEEVEKA